MRPGSQPTAFPPAAQPPGLRRSLGLDPARHPPGAHLGAQPRPLLAAGAGRARGRGRPGVGEGSANPRPFQRHGLREKGARRLHLGAAQGGGGEGGRRGDRRAGREGPEGKGALSRPGSRRTQDSAPWADAAGFPFLHLKAWAWVLLRPTGWGPGGLSEEGSCLHNGPRLLPAGKALGVWGAGSSLRGRHPFIHSFIHPPLCLSPGPPSELLHRSHLPTGGGRLVPTWTCSALVFRMGGSRFQVRQTDAQGMVRSAHGKSPYPRNSVMPVCSPRSGACVRTRKAASGFGGE